MSEQLRIAATAEERARPTSVPLSRAMAAVPQAPVPAPLEQRHLGDYLRLLYKRRWTAATAFLLVFVGITAYTFTATPVFEARTRLLIEADDQNVVNFKQVVEEDRQQKGDFYQTQYNILQSRSLARKTIQALKLWNSPYLGVAPRTARFTIGGMITGAAHWVGGVFHKAPSAGDPPADETSAQSKAIDTFLLNVNISPIRNSRIVDVKYRSSDPNLAADVANAIAKGYIDQNLEYKFMASKEATDWLGARLAEQRTAVEAAEAKLQQYREQNDAISLTDRENITVQKLADLNAALTRAKTDRIQKEAIYRQLQAAQSDPIKLDTFPAILTNAFIQRQKGELADLQRQYAQLSEKLGDKHPDIIRLKSALDVSQTKLTAEVAKVVQSVRSEYQASLSQENSLAAELNQQKGEALSMNRKGIEYSVLQRDVESTKQIYESLLQRAKETGVSGELKASNIRVIDPAERPRVPVSPNKALNLAVALLGGLMLGVGLALFFEYFDSRIKSPEEITGYLGLVSLGMVPALSPKALNGQEGVITRGVPANFAEAIRAIRTNVLFSSAEEGPRSVIVTSSGPGEGKTLMASNLSIALAQTGQRVLIMDGDMRRPRVHSVFHASQEPGLSNLMVGNAKTSECVRRTGLNGLWMLPAGRIPPNPAELLGSGRFKEFLIGLGQHFDWVIIDTPPVLAVTDATVVSNVVSGVVFVVGSETTSRHTAREAVQQLHRARARFIGAILNRVQLERNAYYYSQYYRKEYTTYYQQAAGVR